MKPWEDVERDVDFEDFSRWLRETSDERQIMHAAAAAQVARFREQRVAPALVYRCGSVHRCGLFSAWNLPRGLLFSHPSFRMSDRRSGESRWLGGEAHIDNHRTTVGGASVVAARAYLWDGHDPVAVACDHHYGLLAAGGISEALSDYLRTGQTVRRVASSHDRT